MPWAAIRAELADTAGILIDPERRRQLGGGCINEAWRVEGDPAPVFVKLNRAGLADMFAAEADGLRAILDSGSVRVPRPLCTGVAGDRAYLVLEYLAFGRGNGAAMVTLGRQLAAMHRTTAPAFGWHRDNTIGSTPQVNDWTGDWVEFLRVHRLGYQYELAAANGFGGELSRLGERLLAALDGFFSDHRPQPSLLHGDLWSGNQGVLASGEPVVFDPAVYHGDREADLAMTELFGGFGADFQAAYREAWPLDAGYGVRKVLYNLYHVLNHLNLFGGGYHGQALSMTGRLLAELGH